MQKYIQTKIRKLDNGDVEVVSTLKVEKAITLHRDEYRDLPQAVEDAKKFTRINVARSIFEKEKKAAIHAYAKILLEIDTLEFGWRKMKARRVLDEAFVLLLNAGKWLEEDAEDSGEEKIAGEDFRAGDAVYRGEDGKYRKME